MNYKIKMIINQIHNFYTGHLSFWHFLALFFFEFFFEKFVTEFKVVILNIYIIVLYSKDSLNFEYLYNYFFFSKYLLKTGLFDFLALFDANLVRKFFLIFYSFLF